MIFLSFQEWDELIDITVMQSDMTDFHLWTHGSLFLTIYQPKDRGHPLHVWLMRLLHTDCTADECIKPDLFQRTELFGHKLQFLGALPGRVRSPRNYGTFLTQCPNPAESDLFF